MFHIWWAMGGWNYTTEEPVAGAVRLTRRGFARGQDAEMESWDRARLARIDYGPGVVVVLDDQGRRLEGGVLHELPELSREVA